MLYAEQNHNFEAPYVSGIPGLVGTVAIQVVDNQGAIAFGPSTAGIIETPASSGVYAATILAAWDPGQYTVVWSFDGSFDADTNAIDGLITYEEGADPTLPPLPAPTGSDSLADGPCSSWTTDDEVVECCSADFPSGSEESLEFAISQASAILYRLSGRRYAGTCEKTVRPCPSRGCGGFQILSRGHIVWPENRWGWTGSNWSWPGYSGCGCSPLDRIKLDGYPVRAIIQVKIDGDIILPANNWRLDKDRYLTRLADVDGNPQYWPACQRMDITSDNEVGTFSVRYSWGQDPPWDGMAAASQLACEIFKACSSNGSGDCALPSGVRRITRSGVTIDFLSTLAWFRSTVDGKGFKTGLSLVDAFLNSVNPTGQTRRPVIVTPGKREYPMELG